MTNPTNTTKRSSKKAIRFNATTMCGQTLEEVLEERIFNKLVERFYNEDEMVHATGGGGGENTRHRRQQHRRRTSIAKEDDDGFHHDDNGDDTWRSFGDHSSLPSSAADDMSHHHLPNNKQNDKKSVFRLSQDLYSILATASWRSIPFWISILIIFGFQYLLLILLLANQIESQDPDNPLNLPSNVETSVRISQVLLVIIALFSQDDLLAGIESLVKGFPGSFCGAQHFAADVTRLQWRLSAMIRLVQGLMTVLASFVLSIQSETVSDVLLNVLGVGFISNLDNLSFQLARKGYFGGSMKRMSHDVAEVRFHRNVKPKQYHCMSYLKRKIKKDAHIIIAFAVLLLGLATFTVQAILQNNGTYSTQNIRIEFGDEVLPFLGLFNGCYEASAVDSISRRLVYKQVGYPTNYGGGSGGRFGYCANFGNGDGGWAFFLGEISSDNVCQNYIARSDSTSTFSLLDAAKETNWYTSDEIPLDYLEITEIKAPNLECGQSMFQSTIDACPSILAFDDIPMTRLTMMPPFVSNDGLVSFNSAKGDAVDAAVSHPIYYSNKTAIGDEDGEGITMNNIVELVFFTGRRWIRTSSDHIIPNGKNNNSTSLSEIQDFFFHDGGGLFALMDQLQTQVKDAQWVIAVSEIVDTARDQGSPLGLHWYFPRYETRTTDNGDGDTTSTETDILQGNFPSADLARPMDSVATCLHCNDESNPCFYDGICEKDTGICKNCKHGTSGNLCQVLPLGNGICNLYFNTAEYNYDEGDCCVGTCVGASCGEDDLPNPFLDVGGVDDDWGDFLGGLLSPTRTRNGRSYFVDGNLHTEWISHCVDPRTALVTIEQKQASISGNDDGDEVMYFLSTSVRCDGKLYLRTPAFTATYRANHSFAESIRAPFGASCAIEFEPWFDANIVNNVSIFAEEQQVPLISQQIGSIQEPIRLRIPDSDCVWNTFVDNLVSVFTDVIQDNGNNTYDLSLKWNDYLSEDDYTTFATNVQLDSICNRDSDELLERHALWKMLKSVPKDRSQNFRIGHVCDIPRDEYLYLRCSGRRVSELQVDISTDELPSEIGRFSFLTALSLSNNQSRSLPTEIGSLSLLTMLDLSYNQLTSLPSEIWSLTSLSLLFLTSNQLTSLPSDIGRLTSLQTLALEQNQFRSLPTELGNLASMEYLWLQKNELTSVPSEIGSLQELVELFLQRNQLASIPSEIGKMTSLEILNLFFNPLTANSLSITEIEATMTVLVCDGDGGGYGCNPNSCTDLVDWEDSRGSGDNCDIYETYGYERCYDYRVDANGISGNEACCICGGGVKADNGDGVI